MPKKQFSFDVSGRKLFDSERKAVEAFVRKYAFVSRVQPPSQAIAKYSLGEVNANIVDMSELSAKVSSQARQMETAKASGRMSMAEREARTLSLKAAIFGVAAQPSKK
jgi:hypothetical protein